jgi:hypothetical protein
MEEAGLISVVIVLSQVVQALVIKRGQQTPSANPHGMLTSQQHGWLKQIWERVVLKKT